MLITTKETKEVEVTKDVICNRCGESCKVGNNYPQDFEYAKLKAVWVFYSDVFDSETHKSHICKKCYDAIIAEFKIPPDKKFDIPFN